MRVSSRSSNEGGVPMNWLADALLVLDTSSIIYMCVLLLTLWCLKLIFVARLLATRPFHG